MDEKNNVAAVPLELENGSQVEIMTIGIKPIVTETANKSSATITSIDLDNSDCLSGMVKNADGSTQYVRWDLGGRARDKHTDMNLDMRLPSMRELKKIAKKFGIAWD
jgi:hypothetical protein